MADKLVSIQMPAYNAEGYIARAIESALRQTYPHWELLIVNDGSTDRTEQILAGYQDPRIRVFHQPNGGEAAARNTALAHVRGDYLSFLDADDEYLPEHLALTVDFLESHPTMDGVYTDGYYVNQDGERIKPLSARRRAPVSGDIFEAMVRASDVFGAPLCVVLKHAPVVRRQLEFDPRITIGPDWDFLTAFSEQAAIGMIAEKTCLYRVHQSNISLHTNPQKRLLSLARCREKAIHMRRFAECSVETREAVFYDLLVNLLAENTQKQMEITTWPEFCSLPDDSQSRLYRLMAADTLLRSGASDAVAGWLAHARSLSPNDKRARLLALTYRMHPRICRTLLRLKQPRQRSLPALSPFADLVDHPQKVPHD